MKKGLKCLKIIMVIVIVIFVTLVAFIGVFKREKGIWKNVVPDYKYGMDIDGARELKYTLDDTEEEKYVYVDENGNVISEVMKDGKAITAEEEAENEEEEATEAAEEVVDAVSEATSVVTTDSLNPEIAGITDSQIADLDIGEEENSGVKKETRTIKVNSDENLTKENFEKAKSIIVERLEKQNVESYNIRMDDVTGKIMVETQNDEDSISTIEGMIGQVGKLQMIDYQDGTLLMDNNDIKNVSAVYSSDGEYQAYLQIEYNEEGAKKLKDISNKYVEVKNETTEGEESDDEEESTTYKVELMLDGSKMLVTYFGEEMSRGILQISMGDATTDYNEFYDTYKSAKRLADVLNTGVLPITYELETDNFVKSEITTNHKNIAMIVFVAIIVIISILFIIKYRVKGLWAAILSIGFISVLSIVSRYTNVVITVNSLIMYIIVIMLNYVFMYNLLKDLKNEKTFVDSLKHFYLTTIPVSILTFVFIFTSHTMLNSIGMVLFWGMILIGLYNVLFSKPILKD